MKSVTGPEKFVPKLYGFRIFSLKGSKYEMEFDTSGNKLNDEEVTDILENKKTDAYNNVPDSNMDCDPL